MAVDQFTARLVTSEDLDALHAKEAHPTARIAQRHFDLQAAGLYLYALVGDGSDIFGTCAMDLNPAGPLCPELKSLWVYPRHRRRGAGLALTQFFEQQAASRGYDEVFLRVDPENPAAIPLYIGLDYTPTGDHIDTVYEVISPDGEVVTSTQTDAVFRKSLRL